MYLSGSLYLQSWPGLRWHLRLVELSCAERCGPYTSTLIDTLHEKIRDTWLFQTRTNFGLWLVVGQRREKTGPDKWIVPLIVQMTFEFKSTHLHIQSFLPQFYIYPSSKEEDSCFLIMNLQMRAFSYQLILHLVSKHSFTQRTKCLQEPSSFPFAVLQNSIHWQELTT